MSFFGRRALGLVLALPGISAMTIRVRALSDDETQELARMARSRTLGAGLVRRAQIVQHALQEGLSAPEIAARMGLCGAMVRFWLSGSMSAACRGWRRTCARDGRRPTRPRSGAR